jgi:Rrf2 family protein
MHLLAREETGLRCLLQVALRGPNGAVGRPVPIAQIAASEGISDVYAAKLMRQLRLAGLVESQRGTNGGYRLTRDATDISVWDAIQALDDSFLPGTACDCRPEDRLDCRRTTTCAVTSLWRRLGSEIRQSLGSVSLADLCEGALDRPDRVELPTLSSSCSYTSSSSASSAVSAVSDPPLSRSRGSHLDHIADCKGGHEADHSEYVLERNSKWPISN